MVRWLLFGACILVLLGFLGAGVLNGILNGTVFNGYPADGPFQLYNPLRRLAAGQVPGADFPFFHGVGTLLVHFPLFALFGDNIFASEMSRWITSPVIFIGSGLLFMRALLGDWRRAVVATAIYTAAVLPLGRMVDPSNSLLGIRSFLPLLAAAALIWTPRSRLFSKVLRWRFLTFGFPLVFAYLALGASVSFGTEQGIGAIGAFLLVRAILGWRTMGFRRAAARTAVDAVASVVSVLLFATLLTGGHPIDALRYALIDIPADQGWVFGAPPNITLTLPALGSELTWLNPALFVDYLRSGTPIASASTYLVSAIVAAVLVAWARRSARLSARSVAPLLMLALGTLIVAAAGSLTGYLYLPDQLAPFGRVGLAIASGAAVALLLRPTSDPQIRNDHPDVEADVEQRMEPGAGSERAARAARSARVVAMGIVAFTAVCVVAYSSGVTALHFRGSGIRPAILAAPAAAGMSDGELAGPGWRAALDGIDDLVGSDSTVWSTYGGIIQSSRGQLGLAPGGEDYMIHAIGQERREAYEQALETEAPDAVTTMNPENFPYEEWAWSKWPGFYEELFTDYRLVGFINDYAVWEHSDRAEQNSGASAKLTESAGGYSLPANNGDEPVLYEVTVDYSATAVISPLLRANRYLLDVDGAGVVFPISLPPTQTEWKFLVPVLPGDTDPRLTARTSGIFGGNLEIRGISAKPLEVPEANLELFDHLYCSAHDDGYCPD